MVKTVKIEHMKRYIRGLITPCVSNNVLSAHTHHVCMCDAEVSTSHVTFCGISITVVLLYAALAVFQLPGLTRTQHTSPEAYPTFRGRGSKMWITLRGPRDVR